MGKVLSTEYEPVTLVLADRDDLEEYFKDVPFKGDLPNLTIQAIIGYIDGKPAGIGGVYSMGGHAQVFFDVRPEGRKYKKAIWAGFLYFKEHMLPQRIFAKAFQDTSEPASERLMAKLGFTKSVNGDFRWHSRQF